MGIQIDHTKAKIPPPSAHLIEAMSKHMHDSAVRFQTPRCNGGWDCASIEVQQAWSVIAKAAYAVVAVHGGAKKVEL